MEAHGIEGVKEDSVHSDSQLSQDLLTEALKKFSEKILLKKEQIACLEKLICDRKDVIGLLPTGFGKSIIYQLLPEIHKIKGDNQWVVLVVTPLNAIMTEQAKILNSLGIRAGILREDDRPDTRQKKPNSSDPLSPGMPSEKQIKTGEIDIVFGSAEKWLSKEWQKELKEGNLGKAVSEIAIDEVHVVLEWGLKKKSSKGKKKKDTEQPFREAFGKLADLRALLPGRPVVALSATLRTTNRKLLQRVLSLENAHVISVSPNRDNLMISAINVKGIQEALQKLDWIIDLVRKEKLQAPKTIIFCNVMTDIAHILSYLLLKLGDSAHITIDGRKTWLIGIYHSKSWPVSKEHIEGEFSKLGGGIIKIIIATTALSMGVNYPDIRHIIHFLSPARTLEGHIQQLGRAGRDGEPSYDITIYGNKPLSECEADIKKIFKEGQCLRKGLFQHFDENVESLAPKHSCCSVCAHACNCLPVCKTVNPFSKESAGNDEEVHNTVRTRSVTAADKQEMRVALESEQKQLSSFEGELSIFGTQSLHGFSDGLIDEVVKNLHLLFSSNDVTQLLPIYNVKHARIVLELVQEFFNDIEDFEQQIESLEEGERKFDTELELTSFIQMMSVDIDLPETDSDADKGSSSEEEDTVDDSAFLLELGLVL